MPRSLQCCAVLSTAALLLSACAGGTGGRRDAARAQSRYSHRMHNRFYEAWRQLALVTAERGKISVPVDVQIDRSGRVVHFALRAIVG